MATLRLTFDDKPAGEIVLRPSIVLDLALLCQDCERIYETSGERHCPSCGSAVAMLLAPVLNKQPPKEQ